MKIRGLGRLVFEGQGFEVFSSTLNISKTGGAIFAKFSEVTGLEGPRLSFGPEVGEGSNFGGSLGQSCQKWHCGLEVGRFDRVSENLPRANF